MVRNRLNTLIQKVTPSDALKEDPYISYIKSLALEDRFSYETAKGLIEGYKERMKEDE